MSWQDELRQLDEERALGRVSEDDYRARHAEIVARAQPAPPQQPPGPHAGLDQQAMPQQAAAERTQSITPVRPPVAGQQQHAAFPPAQPVPGQPPPGSPQQPGAAGVEEPPLWGGGTTTDNLWGQPGFDAFAAEPKQSKTGKIVAIVAVVVVVIGLCTGAYFLFFTGHDTTTATPADHKQSSQASPSVPKAHGNPPIATLPGKVAEYPEVSSFAAAKKGGFFTDEENAIYEEAGAARSNLTSSETKGGQQVQVFVTKAATAKQAATARDALGKQQLHFGFEPDRNVPDGVLGAQLPKSDKHPASIRGHYSHGRTVVRVQVVGDNLARVTKLFDKVLAAQLKVTPADVS